MLPAAFIRSMSRSGINAVNRSKVIAQHMMSSSASSSRVSQEAEADQPVQFRSNLAIRTYVLNRPEKLNALNSYMLAILRPKIEVNSAESRGADQLFTHVILPKGMGGFRSLRYDSCHWEWTGLLCRGRRCR